MPRRRRMMSEENESGTLPFGTEPQQQRQQLQGQAATIRAAPGSAEKRTVCDLCRTRRIRCDGQFPCRQCLDAALACKRDHVPRKRGPKRGRGRVINVLRASQAQGERGSRESSDDFVLSPDSSGPQWNTVSSPATLGSVVGDLLTATEPRGSFTTDQYRPTTRSYLHLVPLCVDLYYQHIYPIMPLLYMPAIRAMVLRRMEPGEKNLMFALCALTCFHMSGKSIQVAGPDRPESWEVAGRFFLDECIATRQSYDFLEDLSLYSVISSFWLSTSFFEISQSRKSWVYLREALTLALEMGLDNEATYCHLDPQERLCRQRLFWQLFVTERSFAILRNKPITFRKTPSFPTTRHEYESPEIHSGFLQLISSYIPLDESFVTAWNDGSDPGVSAATYLSLQDLLSHPPAFLSPSRSMATPSLSERIPPTTVSLSSPGIKPSPSESSGRRSGYGDNACQTTADEVDDETTAGALPNEPTAIQKADLLITQQWLRLIVWQSSYRQNLVGPHMQGAMNSAFPVEIARRTAGVLAALPATAVEVHGMGIFEKIYEIGAWCVNVLGFCDAAGGAGAAAAARGVEFLGGSGLVGLGAGENSLDVLGPGLGRKGAVLDPIEFFVRTLSASPNSRTQFAERLLGLAHERPGAMKTALSPALSPPVVVSQGEGAWGGGGSVLGEVADEKSLSGNRTEFESHQVGGDLCLQNLGGPSGDPGQVVGFGVISPPLADTGPSGRLSYTANSSPIDWWAFPTMDWTTPQDSHGMSALQLGSANNGKTVTGELLWQTNVMRGDTGVELRNSSNTQGGEDESEKHWGDALGTW